MACLVLDGRFHPVFFHEADIFLLTVSGHSEQFVITVYEGLFRSCLVGTGPLVATGSQPEKQPIEGLSDEKYFTAQEILQMPEEKIAEMLQGTVAILGGGAVGLETAAFLAQRLPEGAAEFGIKIIEQKEKMGMDMGAMARPLLNELKKKNVSFLTTTATLMDGSKLYVKIGEMTLFVSADTVIWAGGGEPVVDTELTMWLMDERMSYAILFSFSKLSSSFFAIYLLLLELTS